MRYAIAGIILTDAAVLAWAWRWGNASDFVMMIVALLCITFFGSLPVVLGVVSRRKGRQRTQAVQDARVIMRAPPADRTIPPAPPDPAHP